MEQFGSSGAMVQTDLLEAVAAPNTDSMEKLLPSSVLMSAVTQRREMKAPGIFHVIKLGSSEGASRFTVTGSKEPINLTLTILRPSDRRHTLVFWSHGESRGSAV